LYDDGGNEKHIRKREHNNIRVEEKWCREKEGSLWRNGVRSHATWKDGSFQDEW